MAPIDYLISAAGVALLGLVLWRGYRGRMWRSYAFFYMYLGYVLVLAFGQVALSTVSFAGYAMAYWVGAYVALLLRFFVIWEVFRNSFPAIAPVRGVVAQVFGSLAAVIALVILLASRGTVWFFQDMERKAGLAQALLLFATLLFVRYYAVPLGRNIWGIAVGLGLYLSVSIVNFSAYDLLTSFLPFWRYIRPLSFIGMTGIWAWALWSYAPNPRLAESATATTDELAQRWNQAWRALQSALRKAVGL